MVKNLLCNTDKTGSIPGWRTKIPHAVEPTRHNQWAHVSQLESPRAAVKISCAATKIWHNQINKFFKKAYSPSLLAKDRSCAWWQVVVCSWLLSRQTKLKHYRDFSRYIHTNILAKCAKVIFQRGVLQREHLQNKCLENFPALCNFSPKMRELYHL